MSTGEDEPSPCLNGRLRPRKSTSTTTPSPPNKTARKSEGKLAQDRPKRTSTPSKASPTKQDDLVTKSDAPGVPIFLCSYCDRKFNARQTVSKHARRIHLSTSKQDNFIKCLYCNHSDADSNAIIKHMVDSHPNQYFACLDCHTRFPSTTDLAEHKHNVCEKQKPPYRSKLRQNTSPGAKKNPKKSFQGEKAGHPNDTQLTNDHGFNGIVISCELKPSDIHDATDIEDKITTNLILPSSKTLGNTSVEKNAVIVLDDLQWSKRIPPNFNFRNSDADQILSRLGVVHRSPRVGESRKDLIRMMDEPNEKFEKCFDASFYSKIAKNVQENLAKCLDGTFNFNPYKDTTIKTRKSKASVVINTAEGFPILLSHEQFSRNLFDGFIPRAMAPKHKWKWDSAENDKNLLLLLDQNKRDTHVNNCIVTLISSLDIWTQLRMKSKFEEIFKTTPTAKKAEKQNVISMELKDILESRDIPSTSTQVVQYKKIPAEGNAGSELPAYLGLASTSGGCELQPAVLSGEWVRPRCYVCCACGDQTRDARTLSTHLTTQHPNAQVQHYEIVGETLLSADILKHLYVPPSQMSNRTRPPRGFRDCTKCKKSVTLEDLHQHMLDCAGDTPAVRRKCRYRPFGVRRRRPRLPDNTIRKKIRKDIRSRHRQKSHMRPRPRIRTEVGDAETIRKMIADLPAKRNRITPANVLRPRRAVLKTKKQVKLLSSEAKKSKHRPVKSLKKLNKTEVANKQNDTDNSSTIDEDDQPLKLSATRISTRTGNGKEALRRRSTIKKAKKKKQSHKQEKDVEMYPPFFFPNLSGFCNYSAPPELHEQYRYHQAAALGQNISLSLRSNVSRPSAFRQTRKSTNHPYYVSDQYEERERYNNFMLDQTPRIHVKSAGPSNIRCHSGLDDNHGQSRKDRSVGRRDGNNQNNNIAQVPNVPLKHSIASLTSATEGREAPMSYPNPYLLPTEINTSFVHEYVDSRQVFENETTKEKVDKPPLSNNPTYSKTSDEQRLVQNTPEEACNLNANMLSLCDQIGCQNLVIPPLLTNELVESRATSEQMFLQTDSAEHHGSIEQRSFLDNFNESQKCTKQLPKLDDSQESAGLNREDKTAYSMIDTKIESDKTKFSKIRKGLNDCIAMLRTKKGLGLDEQGDDEILESDDIDHESAESGVSTIVSSDPALSGSKTTDKKEEKSVMVAPSLSGKDNDLSKPTDQLPVQTENASLQQEYTHNDQEPASLTPKLHEDEFEQTKTLNRTEPETTKNNIPVGNLLTERYSDVSKNSGQDHSNEDLTLFYRNRVNQTVKSLIDLNIPNLTQDMLEAQAKLIQDEKGEVERQLHDYSHDIAVEIPKQQSSSKCALMIDESNASAIPTSVQTLVTTAHSDFPDAHSQITLNTERLSDEPSPQSTVSPTSKRTRRKAIKKKGTLEHHPEFNSDQSIEQNYPVISPMHQDSRGIGTSPIDLNMRHHNSNNLSDMSPSHETLRVETPPHQPLLLPPPKFIPVRRESCKRVLNSTEISANVVKNKDNNALPKIVTPDIQAANIINLHNLRRHSIELANAQSITANYENFLAQHYQEQYMNGLMTMPQTSQGHTHTNTNPDDWSNDSGHYNKSNDGRSSKSTYVSKNNDTHGVMHVNPRAFSGVFNKSNNRETQDNYKTRLENEQFMNARKQKSNYLKAKRDHAMRVGEHLYSSQDSKTINQKSSALDANSHRRTTRRASEVYYSRPTPYQNNISNINPLDHALDMAFDKNKESYENAFRAYHENVAPFAIPTATYSNTMHMQHNTTSMVTLPRGRYMDEMTPLDLSCDPKARKDQTLDLSKKSSDVPANPCNVAINSEKKIDDVSMNTNFRGNYNEQLQHVTQHSLLSSECRPIEELVHQLPPNMSLQYSGKSNQDMSTQKLTYQPTLTATIAQTVKCVDSDFVDRSVKKSSTNMNYDDETTNKIIDTGNSNNYLIDRFQSLPSECNHFIPREPQCINSEAIYHQKSKQDKMVLENQKNTQSEAQVSLGAKFEDETVTNTTHTNVVNQNVDNLNNHESYHTLKHPITASNVEKSKENDMKNQKISKPDIKPREISTQISNHEVFPDSDNTQNEQDAETARKIAMLPEELVKILGTIPKDHRNQLLNVLPQYVSTPLLNAENDAKSSVLITDVHKNEESRAEIRQDVSACSDMTKLSVNTDISLSSVIPKKRHSPSHSRGRLSSCESQSTGSILPASFAPIMLQRSPIGHNEPVNKCDGSNKRNDSESMVLDPTLITSERDSIDIKLNDLNEVAHLNKNNEVLVSKGTTYFAATPTQDLTLKLHTKQKPSSEQTASLRAVRIKTASNKKTFPDDKLLAKYSYTTNIIENEKYITGQIINPSHQTCDMDPTALQFENSKFNNHQIGINFDADVITQETMRQNRDSFEENIKAFENIETEVETNASFIQNVSHFTEVHQNESNIISHDKHQDDILQDFTCQNDTPQNDKLQDITHQDDAPHDNIPQDDIAQDVRSQDNISKDDTPQYNAPYDDTTQDITIQDDASQDFEHSKSTITLGQSSSLHQSPLQDTNMEVDHFLEQIKLTTFSEDGIDVNEVFSLKSTIISSDDGLKQELMHATSAHFDGNKNNFTTETQNNLLEKTKSPTVSITVEICSDHNLEQNQLTANCTKTYDDRLDNAEKEEISYKAVESSFECKIENVRELSPQKVKSNEDDSEDDVTLAIIKQKHSKEDLNAGKSTTKQSKKSARLSRKDKKKQPKVASRRQKRNLKNTKNIRNNKLSDDVADADEFLRVLDTEKILNEANDNNSSSLAIVLPITSEVPKDKTFDINKENNITENLNVVKENDGTLIHESNDIEEAFDNSDNKKEQKETPKTNIQLPHTNFQQVKYIQSPKEQALSDLNVSLNVEFDATNSAIQEIQSNTVKVNNRMETKCDLSDVETTDKLNLLGSISSPKQNKQGAKELKDVTKKDSTKITTFDISIDNISTDYQLCSGIYENNTLTLRRSRRGKSMYVDSKSIDVTKQIEDHTKKEPVTMKRLILSRVEKDEKRISESSISEKSCDAIDYNLSMTSKVSEIPRAKKNKLTKRKKSPHSKRMSKKIKPINTFELEEEFSDLSNLSSSSKNNSCILRELPYAKNKLTEKDSCKDYLKCTSISDKTSNLSENTTIVGDEKELNLAGANSIDIKETTISIKRKLNKDKEEITLPVSSKSKKIKYHKRKSVSDFDSDDDKVLLETKQNIPTVKHFVDQQDYSNISKEKEDHNEKSPKPFKETGNDILKQTSVPIETRVTCYNRSVTNRKPRSSSISSKDHANYDPYDIDFIDIHETTGPIIKKKVKNSGRRQSAKLRNDLESNITRDFSNSTLHESKLTCTKNKPKLNNESDSDSSKSDVPLQKYVDEKKTKVDLNNKNMKSDESTDDTEKRDILISNQKSLDTTFTIITENSDYKNDEKTDSDHLNVELSPTYCKSIKSPKEVINDGSILCDNDTSIKGDSQNTNADISVDVIIQKHSNKQKKSRRTPAVHKDNKEDQQLRSDKFMENFGFYSERIPRKSNLLASKKISETFHMICNESDDSFIESNDKLPKKSNPNESKKKYETESNVISSEDSKITTDDVTNLKVRPDEPMNDITLNEPGEVARSGENDFDSSTGHAIIESDEVKDLENKLFSSLEKSVEAKDVQDCLEGNQKIDNLDTIVKAVDQIDYILQGEDKIVENPEIIKKSSKSKPNKQPGVKDKMYPDIEEIDMFEDKFDKIKRKRRSQAVAAKQVQIVAETNTSVKSRKQSEKKRSAKSTKKNYQSTQVPTKGALKGFEGIKISISTQDFNMPINVSPPRQAKKRRKTNNKRKKETSDSDSSCSKFDDKEKFNLEKDIYEFKDSEDTELFDLRPSTVMDRFRSMHNKNKFKHKEKDKVKDIEKGKSKSRVKEKKAEPKLSTNVDDKTMTKRDKNLNNETKKGHKKYSSREGQEIEKGTQQETNDDENNLEASMGEACTKIQKGLETSSNHEINNDKNYTNNAIASTSGVVPDRIDESDYESEVSSHEGKLIFYTSKGTNCVCPSDNDTDESDVERGCGRLNCINKNRNADKNAAIGNIFKNNAVRCEKPDTKEPDTPRPNLDQLFDSLLETGSKSNNDVCLSENQNNIRRTSNIDFHKSISSPLPDLDQKDLTEFEDGDCTSLLNKSVPTFDESSHKTSFNQTLPTNSKCESKNINAEVHTPTKSVNSLSCQNDTLSDSSSIQIFTIEDKPIENPGYSLMSEESTQVNFADIMAHDSATKDETNVKKIIAEKSGVSNVLTNYNSEDEFDIDKPETLNRHYLHLPQPAEKTSTYAQTENKIDTSDAESGNESAASKYLKGLSPSEAAKMEIYTMVSAQSTQTTKSKRHDSDSSNHDFSQSNSEGEIDSEVFPKSRIRLQKYDIHEIAHKTKATKGIQTEKNTRHKSPQYDAQTESDEDFVTDKYDRADKEPDIVKSCRVSKNVFHADNDDDVTPAESEDAFTAPASKSTADKHSPRKSDEGISTSHDYSADALDQSFDDAGVARQRARRKCTVGKQNVLAEHWSSESEFDGAPSRPNSPDSVVASAPRKKKSRKKDHNTGGRKTSKHLSKHENKVVRGRGASEESDGDTGSNGRSSRAPPGPKMRARAARRDCSESSSESEEAAPGEQPQHGWICGTSHKKVVTMLAHAKGRKRSNSENDFD